MVPGSAVRGGGERGIGKSTVLLQVAHELAQGPGFRVQGSEQRKNQTRDARSSPLNPEPRTPNPTKVLYVTSEESARQTKLRASRLGAVSSPDLLILAETNVERIVHQIHRHNPA